MAAQESQFFVEDGKPLKFFVDPGSFGRPKLTRTLTRAGASIVSDPKACDFILVQSDTQTGQKFIKDWSAEKLVLEATWVSKSLGSGKLLKEEDKWGDCLAVEDPSVVLEDLDQNHLPTPRITPVEPAPPPSNGPPPTAQSHNSRRHSSGTNAQAFSNNESIQEQKQIPQVVPQPGAQQTFHTFPVPPQFPVASMDPNSSYNQAILDIWRNSGYVMSWAGVPQGSVGSDGMHPGSLGQGVIPTMNTALQHPFLSSGLLPTAHDPNTPSSVSALPSSLANAPSVDVKGKGKATYVPRGSGSSEVASSSTTANKNKIFTSDSGKPLTFYVSVDINKRNDILSPIKKHGGKISTQTTADIAILAFRSPDFESLLETVISSHGTAVKPSFVFDSVARNMLLDTSPYEFELPAKLQRKFQKRTPHSHAKSGAGSKNVAGSQKPKTAKKAVVVKEERLSPTLKCSRIPSPTPPPANTRVLMNGTKYRYPDIEDQYALQYVAVLFDRDRTMSYTSMAKKLHSKMPHHSEGAWHTRLTGVLRDSVDKIRKKAYIAYREEERQQARAEGPVKRPKLSHTDNVSKPDQGDVDRDLLVVAHFFANGGDSEDTEGDEEQRDARIWQKLTQHSKCITEASWETFYDKHHAKVSRLYNQLVEAQE
ncbi:hypothetical protein GGX14DRAFT_421227, partial [Mycena pura]